MAVLASKLIAISIKIALFLGLLDLSVRYVHTYPFPMPENQQEILFAISDQLGIRDPEDLYVASMIVIELAVATLVYAAIIQLWRRYWKSRHSADSEAKGRL